MMATNEQQVVQLFAAKTRSARPAVRLRGADDNPRRNSYKSVPQHLDMPRVIWGLIKFPGSDPIYIFSSFGPSSTVDPTD